MQHGKEPATGPVPEAEPGSAGRAGAAHPLVPGPARLRGVPAGAWTRPAGSSPAGRPARSPSTHPRAPDRGSAAAEAPPALQKPSSLPQHARPGIFLSRHILLLTLKCGNASGAKCKAQAGGAEKRHSPPARQVRGAGEHQPQAAVTAGPAGAGRRRASTAGGGHRRAGGCRAQASINRRRRSPPGRRCRAQASINRRRRSPPGRRVRGAGGRSVASPANNPARLGPTNADQRRRVPSPPEPGARRPPQPADLPSPPASPQPAGLPSHRTQAEADRPLRAATKAGITSPRSPTIA